MTDLIKRLRESARAFTNGKALAAVALEAATALERGVWKPDEEAVARIMNRAFFKPGDYDANIREAARDILALPSLVEGLDVSRDPQREHQEPTAGPCPPNPHDTGAE